MPAIIGGALAGGGALLGGLSSKSAGAQAASAARDAANMQQQRYEQTRADLGPYNTAGQAALPAMNALALGSPTGGGPDYVAMGQANLPGTMTQAELEQTPGYQFARSQGLKAVQSANAARGLGVSGAAMKGAAAFATGLADQTYQNQFTNQQNRFVDINNLNTAQQGNLTNQFGRIQNLATLGANAAAQTGQTGATLAGQQGNALMSGGAAQAAGLTGVGNAITGGINSYLGYNALQGMIGNNANANAPATYTDPANQNFFPSSPSVVATNA
jgi:hypothetical protein